MKDLKNSKTIIFNAVVTIVLVLNLVADIVPLSAAQATTIGVIIAFANQIIRVWFTKEAIKTPLRVAKEKIKRAEDESVQDYISRLARERREARKKI